jgi:hypothetical protein
MDEGRLLERRARLAFHRERNRVEFLRPVRMVMVDRRRSYT